MLQHERRSDRAQGRRSRFPKENWSEAETLERIGSEVATHVIGSGGRHTTEVVGFLREAIGPHSFMGEQREPENLVSVANAGFPLRVFANHGSPFQKFLVPEISNGKSFPQASSVITYVILVLV